MGVDHDEDDYELATDRWTGRVGEQASLGDRRVADRAEHRGHVDVVAMRTPVEERDRYAYFDELRRAEDSARSADTASGALGGWDTAVLHFREQWAEHQDRWPASGRDAVDRSADPPGSWRGDSGRYLDAADNAEVDARCERIAEAERTTISPAMRAIEAADPTRELVGWDHRLKGSDRIKDKVAADIEAKGHTPVEALGSAVKDSIRYTFVYEENSYTDGVHTDVRRLQERGFVQVESRNTWSDNNYRGINSRWLDQTDGSTFEVQFHTARSFEAKQVTHCAYERIRDPTTVRAEIHQLRELQRNVCSQVPIPNRAFDILDYP